MRYLVSVEISDDWLTEQVVITRPDGRELVLDGPPPNDGLGEWTVTRAMQEVRDEIMADVNSFRTSAEAIDRQWQRKAQE